MSPEKFVDLYTATSRDERLRLNTVTRSSNKIRLAVFLTDPTIGDIRYAIAMPDTTKLSDRAEIDPYLGLEIIDRFESILDRPYAFRRFDHPYADDDETATAFQAAMIHVANVAGALAHARYDSVGEWDCTKITPACLGRPGKITVAGKRILRAGAEEHLLAPLGDVIELHHDYPRSWVARPITLESRIPKMDPVSIMRAVGDSGIAPAEFL